MPYVCVCVCVYWVFTDVYQSDMIIYVWDRPLNVTIRKTWLSFEPASSAESVCNFHFLAGLQAHATTPMCKSIECVERWRYHRFKHGLHGKPGIWLTHAVVPNNYENMHSNIWWLRCLTESLLGWSWEGGWEGGRQGGGWGWIMRKDTINFDLNLVNLSRKDAWTYIM